MGVSNCCFWISANLSSSCFLASLSQPIFVRPVPAGTNLPTITFSFKPSNLSTLPLIEASVSTLVVSWKDAAEINDLVSPFIIFIARDHHFNNELFSKINENDIINIRVLGQRYELNNKFISVIAELVDINNYETSKTELENTEPINPNKK